MRVGVPENYYFERLEEDVEWAVQRAIARAEALGARITPVRVPDIAALNAVSRVILLAEASATQDSLRGEVELLTAEIDTLKAERDAAKSETTALQTRITDLQGSQVEFDKRVQIEVARVVASTGTTLPARVTPAGDATQAADLHAQFAAITDPTAQTVFWRKLTTEQQALILKHQA